MKVALQYQSKEVIKVIPMYPLFGDWKCSNQHIWLLSVLINNINDLTTMCKILFWLHFIVWCVNVMILQNNHSVIAVALFYLMGFHWLMGQYNSKWLYFHMLSEDICFSQLRETLPRRVRVIWRWIPCVVTC